MGSGGDTAATFDFPIISAINVNASSVTNWSIVYLLVCFVLFCFAILYMTSYARHLEFYDVGKLPFFIKTVSNGLGSARFILTIENCT